MVERQIDTLEGVGSIPTSKILTDFVATLIYAKGANMFNPGDLIIANDRKWKVTGNYLGAIGQESVVGMIPIDMSPAHDEIMVPEDMLNMMLGTKTARQYREV